MDHKCAYTFWKGSTNLKKYSCTNYLVTIIYILQSLREAPSVGGINDLIQDQSNEDENTMENRNRLIYDPT